MFLKLADEVFDVEGVDPDALMRAYAAPSPLGVTYADKWSDHAHSIRITPQLAEEERRWAESPTLSQNMLARTALLRQIAEIGPQLGLYVAHMAVVEYRGLAYAFAAPSGTGKSTHLRLWTQTLGADVTVINGDKPILRLSDASASPAIIAYGTPWAGKEGWQTNTSAPLAGLCLLTRGAQDECRRISPVEALPRAMRQVYMPEDPISAALTLDFLDVLLREAPLYQLTCTMERSAVKASFEAMTGLDFQTCAQEAKHED